jgi:hypothetical protein
MQALTLEDELRHASEVLKVREREFAAAQSHLIQAQDRYNELSNKWARQKFDRPVT